MRRLVILFHEVLKAVRTVLRNGSSATALQQPRAAPTDAVGQEELPPTIRELGHGQVTLTRVNEERPTSVDIIFIHGINSGADAAWRADGVAAGDSWPDWVAAAHAESDVWLMDYPADLFWISGSSQSVYERSRGILGYLEAAGLLRRPTAVIAHSMGGLVFKAFMNIAATYKMPEYDGMASQVKLVLMLAVPHEGAALADLARLISILPRGAALRSLILNNEYLLHLNGWFSQYVNQGEIGTVRTYYEKKPVEIAGISTPFVVVPRESARMGVLNEYEIGFDDDHIGIAKPRRFDLGVAQTARPRLASFVRAWAAKTAAVSIVAATPEPRLAASLTYTSETGVDLPQAKRLLGATERSPIAYPPVVLNAIAKLRGRNDNILEWVGTWPGFRKQIDPKAREERVSAEHLVVHKRLARIEAIIEQNETALDNLIARQRDIGVSEEQTLHSLRKFAVFAVTRIVHDLKKNWDWIDEGGPGRPEYWFLNWKLNDSGGFSQFDLVPEYSATGERLLGHRRLVGARVGISESIYEYVLLPFEEAKTHFKSYSTIPAELFYEWVLPQIALHSHYPLDYYTPDGCRIFVLVGQNGVEWYFPGQPNPWGRGNES